MALSTCIKCGGTTFELRQAEPAGAMYVVVYLQCMSCGGVAGITDYFDIGTVVKQMEAEVKSLQEAVQARDYNVRAIASRRHRTNPGSSA